MPTTTTSNTYTGTKRMSLSQAHKRILMRTDMSEAQWLRTMFEYGCRFAGVFSNMFPNPAYVNTLLLQSPAKENMPNNSFWMWWRMKWMLDDEAIINNSCLDMNMTYPHIKCYMIGDEQLELELLNMIDSSEIGSEPNILSNVN